MRKNSRNTAWSQWSAPASVASETTTKSFSSRIHGLKADCLCVCAWRRSLLTTRRLRPVCKLEFDWADSYPMWSRLVSKTSSFVVEDVRLSGYDPANPNTIFGLHIPGNGFWRAFQYLVRVNFRAPEWTSFRCWTVVTFGDKNFRNEYQTKLLQCVADRNLITLSLGDVSHCCVFVLCCCPDIDWRVGCVVVGLLGVIVRLSFGSHFTIRRSWNIDRDKRGTMRRWPSILLCHSSYSRVDGFVNVEFCKYKCNEREEVV